MGRRAGWSWAPPRATRRRHSALSTATLKRRLSAAAESSQAFWAFGMHTALSFRLGIWLCLVVTTTTKSPQTHKSPSSKENPNNSGRSHRARVMHTARKRKQSSVLRECTVHRRPSRGEVRWLPRRSPIREEAPRGATCGRTRGKKTEKEKEHLTGGDAAPTA